MWTCGQSPVLLAFLSRLVRSPIALVAAAPARIAWERLCEEPTALASASPQPGCSMCEGLEAAALRGGRTCATLPNA
jgi:hypothetical protein